MQQKQQGATNQPLATGVAIMSPNVPKGKNYRV